MLLLLLLLSCNGDAEPPGCAPEGSFREISIGSHHGCALTTEGLPVCWGRIGDASDPTDPFMDVQANGQSSCGLKRTGALECWGQTQWTAPRGEFVELSLGYNRGYAIKTDGQGVIWDSDEEHEAEGALTLVSGGVDHFCAVREDGSSYCIDITSQPPQAEWTQLESSDGYTCGRTVTGTLSCWGSIGEAEIPTPPDGEGWLDIAPGWSHFCALDADGAILCEGIEEPPELEEGVWVDVGSGQDWACGLDDAGSIHCWGDCPA